MKRTNCTIAALLFVISQTPLAWSLPWNKDLVDQLAIKAQEGVAPLEPGSIPVVGGETLPTPITEAEQDAAKDEAASIPTPVPASADSLARGKYLYEVNCLVCHGATGVGDGPVGLKFVTKAPVDLNEDYTQDQADGQLFFTITRGRALMPYYRDALNIEERWHVVNYLKQEFGN